MLMLCFLCCMLRYYDFQHLHAHAEHIIPITVKADCIKKQFIASDK